MKKLVILLSFILSFKVHAMYGTDHVGGSNIDCLQESIPSILDDVNIDNLTELARVNSYGSNPNYPTKWPKNMKDIMQPNVRAVCDAYFSANDIIPSYNSIMENIDKHYPGGRQEFFFKYVLTMDCWAFRKNFFDDISYGGNYSSYLGTMMKSQFGGVDPNAYIRIEREGKVVEGPIYHVFAHLEKNYPKSKRAREYAAVMRRLKSGKRFNLYPVKSIAEIRKEDPAMPINVD